MKKENWIWMPHAGHLIVGRDCRFHLNTYVGGYIVSTVGEYLPDSKVREILWESKFPGHLIKPGDDGEAQFIKEHGYVEIGYQRTFETMVFEARKSTNGCCPWEQSDGMNIDTDGYSTPEDAYRGHLAMCEKWAKKRLRKAG